MLWSAPPQNYIPPQALFKVTVHPQRPVYDPLCLWNIPVGSGAEETASPSLPNFAVFAHVKHMISRKRVLGRDRELDVFHFLFLFLFLIAQSLISLGLC